MAAKSASGIFCPFRVTWPSAYCRLGNRVIFHRGQTEHLAHRRQPFNLLIGKFRRVLRLIAFQPGNLRHQSGGHIHRDHQLTVQRFNTAVQFIGDGLRRGGRCAGSSSAPTDSGVLSPLAFCQLSGEIVSDGLPFNRIGSELKKISVNAC